MIAAPELDELDSEAAFADCRVARNTGKIERGPSRRIAYHRLVGGRNGGRRDISRFSNSILIAQWDRTT